MNVKVTEKELLGRIAEAMKARGYAFTAMAREATQQAIAEVGLEFAPEAPALPERLEMDGMWIVVPGKPANLVAAAEAGLLGLVGQDLSRAILAEAVRRCNTYPPLRAALAELARQARGLTECHRPAFPPFAEAIEAAEASLAQAPEGGQ